jgi:hypothetical protein
MADEIRFQRGPNSRLPLLDNGEPAVTTDGDFFIGTPSGNVQFAKQQAVEAVSVKAEKSLQTLSVMRDPLAYLNSVEVLCTFPVRYETGMMTWIQGFSMNESANEIYVANQENGGTVLRIDVRNLDGTLKNSKTLAIESGAYTESLPYFYQNEELCFVVRTQSAETYAIYNYTTEVLSGPVAITGKYKSAVDGDYFITCDATSSAPYTIKNIYVYDWESVKNSTPSLLNSFRLDHYGDLPEKAQGIVLNNGYIFVTQGAGNGQAGITVYNTAGQLVNSYLYTKESVANAVNVFRPNTIANPSFYAYENEGGWIFKGKLVCLQIIEAQAYLFVHNSPSGEALETKVPIYRIDTGWVSVTLLNGAVEYAPDTTPRIRRIGNQIILSGAIKGFTTLNLEYIEFYSNFAPERNFQTVQVTSSGYQCNWQIQPNGRARILNTRNPTPDATTWYPFHITWFL